MLDHPHEDMLLCRVHGRSIFVAAPTSQHRASRQVVLPTCDHLHPPAPSCMLSSACLPPVPPPSHCASPSPSPPLGSTADPWNAIGIAFRQVPFHRHHALRRFFHRHGPWPMRRFLHLHDPQANILLQCCRSLSPCFGDRRPLSAPCP